VAVSKLLIHYPVLSAQAARYAIGATALLAVTRLRRQRLPRPTGRDLALLLALGAVGLAGFNILLLAALQRAEPAAVAVVSAACPCCSPSLGRCWPALLLRWRAGQAVRAALLPTRAPRCTPPSGSYAFCQATRGWRSVPLRSGCCGSARRAPPGAGVGAAAVGQHGRHLVPRWSTTTRCQPPEVSPVVATFGGCPRPAPALACWPWRSRGRGHGRIAMLTEGTNAVIYGPAGRPAARVARTFAGEGPRGRAGELLVDVTTADVVGPTTRGTTATFITARPSPGGHWEHRGCPYFNPQVDDHAPVGLIASSPLPRTRSPTTGRFRKCSDACY
jgi:EamA-like transporter family